MFSFPEILYSKAIHADLDPEDDHVPIPHRIEEFYQRMGDGENWKQIGMFMVTNMGGCLCDVGQLEYKLSFLAFQILYLCFLEVLCLILGKPEQSLKPYSTFNNFPPGIFPASFHHKPVLVGSHKP